jgi:two-component system response regulator
MDNKVILLVENKSDDVALAERALKKANIVVTLVVVRDGAAALDYVFATGAYAGRDSSLTPQVILLDLNLPKISGLEVLKRLRADERTRLLPVVVLTSSKEERDLVESYKFGANSYVRKPVNFEQFADAVRQLGQYWLVLNEPPPVRGAMA